ncbi:histidine decarboxylase [Micromonospora sp. C51]|uniref:histidine decarboxylase n=1 Tax=Micromonospora sp. C51 TaxID=2824879 RepID=UPI001B35F925|nr:histidine decarboxylase [Micromonospora sp. C51]MBQ1052178.1 histidine decarboxylase [Micromonospora sp. C51]
MARTVLNGPDDDPRLSALLRHLGGSANTYLGFPAAVDLDYRTLSPFLGHLLNNVGDPGFDPTHPHHSKPFEREVLAFFADLFRAPQPWTGYVSSGGSESNLWALYRARSRYPDGVVFHSAAAHYSVSKAAHLLGMPTVVVSSQRNGEIDYDELACYAELHRRRPIIVVATIGTTMTEAVDDVAYIQDLLADVGVRDRHIHSDAALSGVPLALSEDPPGFDLTDGADSICVSGHKFFGTPVPCSVVIARHHDNDKCGKVVAYTGSPDTTITGSRNGLAVLMLWVVLQQLGRTGLRIRAESGRDVAQYAHQRLLDIGWPSWRNPQALTVVLRRPPPAILARWPMPTLAGLSHFICMPGVTRGQVDQLTATLAAMTLGAATPACVKQPAVGAPMT